MPPGDFVAARYGIVENGV